MSEWEPYNNGLPNVIVNELEIHYGEGTISAATYGRGVWTSPLQTLSTSIEPDYKNTKQLIYPNPASEKITINTNANKFSINIYSLTGKKLISTSSKEISIAKLKRGYYIIEIKTALTSKKGSVIIK